MWIFTRVGAASIVKVPLDLADPKFTEIRNDGGLLVGYRDFQVRGRDRGHLEAIKSKYCEGPGVSDIQERAGSDYQYRFYITGYFLEEMLKEVASDIDYGNFKDAADLSGGYGVLLHAVWHEFYRWSVSAACGSRIGNSAWEHGQSDRDSGLSGLDLEYDPLDGIAPPVMPKSPVERLVELAREMRDRITELEGEMPSTDERVKYADKLCAEVEGLL